MKKINLVLIGLILAGAVGAQGFIERRVSVIGSNIPLGANLSLGLAYNQKIWDHSENQAWLYGFVRPKLTYDTSFYTNAWSAEMQLYPISLLGVAFGSSYADRAVKDITQFECETFNCKGQLRRNYFRLNLNLGYRQFFASFGYQKDFNYTVNSDVPLVEFNSLLLLPVGESEMEKRVGFVGYKFTERFDFGILAQDFRVGETLSKSSYLVTNYKRDDFKYTVGVGTAGTDYNAPRGALFLKITWMLDPTLNLSE